MKAVRFVLVLVFLFTLAISPAQAKGGERYSFVPLVTKVSSAVPLRVQAQQAFHRLTPKLMALQKKGVIVEFEPEFNAGILKIKYAAGATVSTFGTAQVFDTMQAAMSLVPHKQAAMKNVHPEATVPIFYATLYDSCFYAYNLGVSTRLVASLRNKANVLIANYAGYANASGYLFDCFNWNGAYTNIQPGYTLTFKIYNTAGTGLLGTYTTSAPPVNYSTFNKAASTVSGTATFSKPYLIYWYHQNLNAANTYLNPGINGTTSATGQWAVDFGAVPFRGADYFTLYATKTANFVFIRYFDVPYAYCEVGSNYCGVYGFPGQPASITIIHAGITYNFSGKSNSWGWFGANVEDAVGDPIFLASGDPFGASGITPYYLPNLTASVNFTNDVVSGMAPANKYFWVEAYDVFNDHWHSIWSHSSAASTYAVDFTPLVDLKATDALTIELYYKDPVTGNVTSRFPIFGP